MFWISLILTILAWIWLNRLINFGIKRANEIAFNTEKTAHYTQMMWLAMPEELRQRSAATLASLQEPAKVTK